LQNKQNQPACYYFIKITCNNKCYAQIAMGVASRGFRVGGAEARLKRGPLMTSSYSSKRDNHFWFA